MVIILITQIDRLGTTVLVAKNIPDVKNALHKPHE